MTEAPNIPFMAKKGQPPYHLRPFTPEELEQHRRMIADHEWRRKKAAADRENDSND